MKMVIETIIKRKLANTIAPLYSAGSAVENESFMCWMNTAPFSKPPWPKTPATTIVAPVSLIDLAKAKMKAEIIAGLKTGKVTVRIAVNGAAPRVLEALSYSTL